MKTGKFLSPFAFAALALFFLASCASVAERKALAVSYTELGNAFAEQKKWDKAGESWSRALELDPKQGIAGFNLIRALVEAGKFDEARARAEALLPQDPENVLILTVYAYSLYKAGENDKAIEVYEKAFTLNAKDTLSLFNLAVLNEAAGKTDDAIARYRELLELEPENENGNLRLGILLADLGAAPEGSKNLEDALLYIERYLALKPDSVPALKTLARIHEKSGAYAKAIDALKALAEKQSEDATARFDLARLRLVFADDSEGGLEDLKQALDLGFKDELAIEKLLAVETLPDRDKVIELLAGSGLGPEAVEKTPDGEKALDEEE